MSTTTLTDLLEYFPGGTQQVDREAGVIKKVKILGLRSANGRTYTKEAVAGAKTLYEGRVVNINHPGRGEDSVPVERRFGWLREVQQDAAGELWGDLHFLKSHPWAAPILEAAERNPSLFGLSHNAKGKLLPSGVVESVHEVHSVDLVADPATVKGLFESKIIGKPMKKIKLLLEAWAKGAQSKLKVLREMEEAGMPVEGELPAETPADDSGVASAFEQMVLAVLKDTSLDAAGKIAKIKEILKAQEKLTAATTPEPATATTGASEKVATESKRLREELAVRDLLEATPIQFSSVGAKKAFIKALLPLTEDERKALIEERASTKNNSGVISGIREERKQTGKIDVPKDAKGFASFVKS